METTAAAVAVAESWEHDTHLAVCSGGVGTGPDSPRASYASGRSSILSGELPILRATENGEERDDREHQRGGEVERGGRAAHRVLDPARERRQARVADVKKCVEQPHAGSA